MLEGGQRNENFSYPDEEYFYYIAADRFGWTPAQVDDQPAVLMDYLIAISTVVEDIRLNGKK